MNALYSTKKSYVCKRNTYDKLSYDILPYDLNRCVCKGLRLSDLKLIEGSDRITDEMREMSSVVEIRFYVYESTYTPKPYSSTSMSSKKIKPNYFACFVSVFGNIEASEV